MERRQGKTPEEASAEYSEKKEEREIRGIDYSLRLTLLKDIYEKQGQNLSKRLKNYTKKYLNEVISGERAPSKRLRNVINRRFRHYANHKEFAYVARPSILFFDRNSQEYISFDSKTLKAGTLKIIEKGSSKSISSALFDIYSRYPQLMGENFKVSYDTAKIKR